MNNIDLRWFVDRDTGSWVLQYLNGWVKVPVVFADEAES